jgi:hypothetical protein
MHAGPVLSCHLSRRQVPRVLRSQARRLLKFIVSLIEMSARESPAGAAAVLEQTGAGADD